MKLQYKFGDLKCNLLILNLLEPAGLAVRSSEGLICLLLPYGVFGKLEMTLFSKCFLAEYAEAADGSCESGIKLTNFVPREQEERPHKLYHKSTEDCKHAREALLASRNMNDELLKFLTENVHPTGIWMKFQQI
jgi:hypothetical protein